MDMMISALKMFGSSAPPPPTDLVLAPANGLYANIFFGIFGIAAFVWAIYLLVRQKTILPLLLILGGALVVIDEAIVDVLGKIIYAPNYTWKFVSFARDMPLWLIAPYAAFLGISPYYVARAIQQGSLKRKTLYLISVLIYFSVFALDYVVSKTGHYQYYGEGVLNAGAGSFVMAAYPLVSGYMMRFLFSRKGPGVMVASVLLPSIAFGATFGATTFPLCFALNTELSPVFDVLFRLMSVIQTVGIVWFVTEKVVGESKGTQPFAKPQIQY